MNELPDWLDTAILGLLQGLTEFLPISSSGHLLAFKEALNFQHAPLALDVALHVATLAAVLIYFRGDLGRLLVHPGRFRILLLLALATLPGAALGALLADWRAGIGPWWVVGGWAFSSAYLLVTRRRRGEGRYATLSFWKAFCIGGAQALAIFPGVSRSGSTISSGLWLGLEREEAFRFSFLLAIPIILGAGLKEGLSLSYESLERCGGWPSLALGMAIAFGVGLAAIHWLLGIVRGDRLHFFGWYNLAAGLLLAAYLTATGKTP